MTILDDSGIELGAEGGEIISMIRAREDAQAALAEAAAAAKASAVASEADSTQAVVGAAPGGLVTSLSGGVAEAREAEAAPSTSRAPAKKRVAKAVTSRGVRLRNRII